jgi:hypothetical protein
VPNGCGAALLTCAGFLPPHSIAPLDRALTVLDWAIDICKQALDEAAVNVMQRPTFHELLSILYNRQYTTAKGHEDLDRAIDAVRLYYALSSNRERLGFLANALVIRSSSPNRRGTDGA